MTLWVLIVWYVVMQPGQSIIPPMSHAYETEEACEQKRQGEMESKSNWHRIVSPCMLANTLGLEEWLEGEELYLDCSNGCGA